MSKVWGASKDALSKVKENKEIKNKRFTPPIVRDPLMKCYRIDFLLSFKEKCTAMPDGLAGGLPRIDFEEDELMSKKEEDGDGEGESKIPEAEAKPLHTSNNRWTSTEATGEDLIIRNAQLILNKLTIEKFDKLCNEFSQIEISNSAVLSHIVELVILKAQKDMHFSEMYAALCVVLSEKKYSFDSDETTFKKVLLEKVGNEFFNGLDELEKEKKEAVEESKLKEGEDEMTAAERVEENRKKRRSKNFGNIQFIGELFNAKLLKAKRINDIIQQLFGDLNAEHHDEVHLEILCRLLTIVGKELDEGKNSKLVSQYIGVIDNISKKDLPSRVKFMLKEVVELKGTDWVNSRKGKEHPTTLANIHGRKPQVVVDEEGWISGPALPKSKKVKNEEKVVEVKKVEIKKEDAKKNNKKSGGKSVAEKEKSFAPELELNVVQTKSRSILNEYFINLSMEEVLINIQELRSPTMLIKFCQTGILMVIEMKENEREVFSKFLIQLFQSKVINSNTLTLTFVSLFEQLEDLIIDVPMAATFISKMLGKFVANSLLNLEWLKTSLAPHVQANNRAQLILKDLLLSILASSNAERVKSIMLENNLSIADFIFEYNAEKKSSFSASVLYLI